MNETWKPVPSFEGLYEASSLGNLRRLERRNTRGAVKKAADIKQSLHKQGYLIVTLTNKEGLKKVYTAHRLIARTFIENPNNKQFVNHKNGIKSDNRVENLEWCTKAENNQHAWDTGLMKPRNYYKDNTIKPLEVEYE